MKLAAITGLEAEARIARGVGIEAAASGGREARTLERAEAFLRGGADALISFGIAGALAPQLATGTLLLPRTVIDETGERYPVDDGLRSRVAAKLARAGFHVADGDLLGATHAAASLQRKAALFRLTSAVAVDLESHLVARAATYAGKPFLVLRAIADPASRALPPAAVDGLDENGAPAIGRVFASVLRHPGQIRGLLRLAGDTRRALFALRSALNAGPL